MNAPRYCSANFGSRLVFSRLSQRRLQGALAPICSPAPRGVLFRGKSDPIRLRSTRAKAAEQAPHYKRAHPLRSCADYSPP
jgi:hypothetical protein